MMCFKKKKTLMEAIKTAVDEVEAQIRWIKDGGLPAEQEGHETSQLKIKQAQEFLKKISGDEQERRFSIKESDSEALKDRVFGDLRFGLVLSGED